MKNVWWNRLCGVLLAALLVCTGGVLEAKPKGGSHPGKGKGLSKAEKQQQKAEKRDSKAMHTFDYFPSQQVYYNRTTDTYFWIDNGLWQHRAKYLPGNITIGGKKERIRISGDTPYAYHRIHCEHLPYSAWKDHYAKRRGPPDHAPAWGYRRQHDYIYYPDRGVYYEPESKSYAWVEAGKMKIGFELPEWIKVDPFLGVKLELDRPISFEDFKKH